MDLLPILAAFSVCGFEATVEGDAEQGDGGADEGVEYPEEVGRALLMDNHVATDLAPVEAVIPDLEGGHNLK